MKKTITMVIAVLLAVALFASCSQTGEPAATNETKTQEQKQEESTTSEVVSEEQEPVEMTWVANAERSGTFPTDDCMVVQYLNETYNVKITPLEWDVFSEEAINLKIASGEFPDVWIWGDYQKFYEQGLLRTISLESLKENMPAYYSLLEEYDPNSVGINLFTQEEGLVGIPQFTMASLSGFMRILRQDWLDNLGLSVPATTEELENVMRAFTFDDPDQNGSDDTYGMSVWRNTNSDLFGAFGVMPDTWVDMDGEVTYSNTSEGYKEALKLLASWNEKGYIDPEFITDSQDTFKAKFSEGKFGSYVSNWRWLTPTEYQDTPAAYLVDKNEGANWKSMLTVIDSVKGPEGKSGTLFYSTIGITKNHGVLFGASTSDAVVEKVMEIMNDQYAGEEVLLKVYAGNEGETFEWTEQGSIQYTVSLEEKVAKGVGNFFWSGATTPDVIEWRFGREGEGGTRIIFDKGMQQPSINSVIEPYTVVENSDYLVDIKTITDEFYINAITNMIDIDAEWDGYVESVKNAGLDNVAEEVQTIYDNKTGK